MGQLGMVMGTLALLVGFLSPAEGTLRIVGDRQFPPFMFLDERQEPAGLDAAVIRLVGERLGLACSIDLLPWAMAVASLETGSADLIAAMNRTPDREARFRFLTPHNTNHLTIFTRVAATHIDTSGDLLGRRVGVQRRDLAEEFCRKFLPGADLWLYEDQPRALRALADGEIDAFVGNEAVVVYTMARDHLTSLFRQVPSPLLSSPYAMAVRSDDAVLAASLDMALESLSRDGTLERARERWLHALPNHIVLRRQLRNLALGLGGVVLLTGFGVAVLGWRIRRATLHLEEERRRLTLEVEERHRVEHDMERNRRFVEAVVEHVPEAILVKELDSGRYTVLNRAVEELFGIPRDTMIGRTDGEIFGPVTGEIFAAQDRTVAHSSRSHTFPEIPLLTPHRDQRIFVFTKILLPGTDRGRSGHLLAIAQDVTERRRTEEALRHASFHDSMTGLHNRAYFEEEMHRMASGRQNPLGLLICDVDGLKIVNDVLGHAAGDSLLRGAAETLRRTFRCGDVIARIGGDEFAVLLPSCPPPTAWERRNALLSAVTAWNSHSFPPLGLSLGLAFRETPEKSLETLFREADQAMYRHKEERREAFLAELFRRIEGNLVGKDDEVIRRKRLEELRPQRNMHRPEEESHQKKASPNGMLR